MARFSGQKPLAPAEKQKITQRYIDGEGIEALCRIYRRGKSTIKQVLADSNVTLRPRGNPTGTVWSSERRAAHLSATRTDEFRQAARERLLQRLPSMRGPAVNSPIERRLHDALRRYGIGFSTQPLLLNRYLVDMLLHQAPIIIEADGAQHTLRDQRQKDAIRDADLIAAGYRIFRFTGSEINRDVGECIRHVIDSCGLTPEENPNYEIRTKLTGSAHPRWKGGKAKFTCERCGNTFLAQPKHRACKRTFCSRACYHAAQRG